MYLKSIEIHGFKSFANKIKFEFHNGITGIVGPNGSGKSNVADAVRWVLGEQKIKQLRSSKMEDVIFAGTENRKPMGYSYVAITFDNSDHKLNIDYTEVTVSRRLFRSGESEYMINGTQVRLKDVNELFYDTGIGKEGYSIIGQGQIDKILSGKPEERRELFDEAAGIVKFKRRKNDAMKKLDDQNQNLVRVTDILGELERQVVPLEKQCEKAKKYLVLKEDLKVNDVNLYDGTILIYGKGSKERRIQIGNESVIKILAEYNDDFCSERQSCTNFFVNQSGKALSDQSIRRMINKYTSLASIEQHITPHMFRHTFATSLLEADVDIRYIQEMLGHSSINITEIYTHVTVAKQRNILATKHPRKDFDL